jgi:APA family basic amino acid/polyamine antiporter
MSNPTQAPRKTLGLTGITINAMALVAPGAFAWLLYQAQLAGAANGLGGLWPGVFAALVAAMLTALSFGELARKYPEAGFRSAYHFAEQVFRDRNHPLDSRLARFAKFATGWAAHLYYWVYPGVMVAFLGILADYLLRQMGYSPTPFGQVLLAMAFSAFIGFLALRGITGTTSSSIILNLIQLITLAVFIILAILFRVLNPLQLAVSDWTHPQVAGIFNLEPRGLFFQAALAMMLMVGFESVTSFGASAANPKRDIPRGTLLALIIQGIFSYLLVYFAAEFALNNHLNLVNSRAPLGELAIQLGDQLLAGNGYSLMFILGFMVVIALLGAMLTSTNNGVRISFSMSLDAEMPDLLSVLHPKYATPYYTVIILSVVSAIIGSIGILGGLPALIGIILASNLGAFLLYAILGLLTVAAFAGTGAFHWLRHGLLPVAGIILNLALGTLAMLYGLSVGGVIGLGCLIALSLAGVWLLANILYYFLRRH